ncbi:MAG: Glycerophosphoryl diester phosphodiesterase [Rhodobacteraceae bacterium HLUCCA08]|nr:MAG: Glycerophosphoryl diester phosphodiesterase [Rhodobacteraceae bacterium HLUCCA08]
MLPPGFLDRPFAHRGLHGGAAVENSLSAVRAAVAAGYGIEIDIQPSADGVPMVFHDYDMGRLTGRPGPLRGLSARQLGETPLTGGAGDTVPTLAQVLEAVAGAVPLLIEIKDQDGALGPGVGPLEDAVCGALAGYDGPVALMSFNPHAVAACAGAAPRIPRGLTTCAFTAEDWPTVPQARRDALRAIPDLDRTGASFVSHDRADLTAAPLHAVRQAGLPVLCWTIRSPDRARQARAEGAAQITFEGFRP